MIFPSWEKEEILPKGYVDRTVLARQYAQMERDRQQGLMTVHLKIPRTARAHFVQLAREQRLAHKAELSRKDVR
jgi:hypothetical protein